MTCCCLCLDERAPIFSGPSARLLVALGQGEARCDEGSGQSKRGIATKRNETRQDDAGVGEGRAANGEGQSHGYRRLTTGSAWVPGQHACW